MNKLKILFSIAVLSLMFMNVNQAQTTCPISEVGLNQVTNGDFELGDTLFNAGTHLSWNDSCGFPSASNCFGRGSFPNEYWIHDNASEFNGAFSGSPYDGDYMMLVDATCDSGQVIWSQDVVIDPNTNYFFETAIASIFSKDPGQLTFVIDGNVISDTIFAPDSTDEWSFYRTVWNSGGSYAPGTTITISISGTGVGCSDGNDFALDGVVFQEGCGFGNPGPSPDLGDDLDLCFNDFPYELNVDVTRGGYTDIYWSTGVNDGDTSITITGPGNYSVCVDSAGSCLRSDIVTITSNSLELTIGADQEICDPMEHTFTSSYAGTSFQWYKDGNVLLGETDQSYTATATGTYSVVVTDVVCPDGTDEAVITTPSSFTANDEVFCPTPTDMTLSVNGNAGSVYDWYDSQTGGTLLDTNTVSYLATNLTTDTVFWVENTGTLTDDYWYDYAEAPLTSINENLGSYTTNETHVYFRALADGTLNSVDIRYLMSTDLNNLDIILTDSTGTEIDNVTVPKKNGAIREILTVDLGFSLTQGVRYGLSFRSSSNPTVVTVFQDGASYAGIEKLGVIDFIGIELGDTDHSGPFFNWNITSDEACARVPVVVTQYCVDACVLPASVSIAPTSPVICAPATETLTASPSSGYDYMWFKDGVALTSPTLNDDDYDIDTAGTYYVRLYESGDTTCFLEDVVDATYISVDTVVLPDSVELCDPMSYDLDAGVSGGYTYAWFLDGVDQGSNTQTYTANTAGTYRVEATNTACSTSSTDSTVITASVVTPVNDTWCADSVGTLSITQATSTGTYDWFTSDTASTAVVNDTNLVTIDPLTNDTTLYVENTAISAATQDSVGPTTMGAQSYQHTTDNYMSFEVYADTLILDRVTVRTRTNSGTCSCTFTPLVYVDNSGIPGALFDTGETSTYTIDDATPGTGAEYVLTDMDIKLPGSAGGVTYWFRYTTSCGAGPHILNTSFSYAYTNTDEISITGARVNNNPSSAGNSYNWVYTIAGTGSACARAPVFVTAGTGCAQPVDLLEFTATLEGDDVLVEWTTATEENNARFEVLRSTNGEGFEVIGIVEGAGNSSDIRNYTFVDESPLLGTSYYMLRQVDFDGTISDSDWRSVNSEGEFTVDIYPNPFTDNTNVLVNNPTGDRIEVTLIDVTGKILYTTILEGEFNEIELGDNLADGMYFVKVASASDTQAFKILKRH